MGIFSELHCDLIIKKISMNAFKTYVEIREKVLPMGVEKIKKGYMNIFHPNRIPWNETTKSLSRFEKNTLGYTLYEFFKNGNIELEPKYESHDVYHVLTGYGLGLINESSLIFFLLGNGKRSVSIIVAMVVAIIFIPEQWSQFYKHYQRGKTFSPIKNIDFEQYLDYNIDSLRAQLKVSL